MSWSSTHGYTPYHKLFQKQSSYSNLRVFGCLYFLHIVTPHKHSPRSIPCVFLRYPSNHKGYICLNLDTQETIISYHVVFDETVFPLGSMPWIFHHHTLSLAHSISLNLHLPIKIISTEVFLTKPNSLLVTLFLMRLHPSPSLIFCNEILPHW